MQNITSHLPKSEIKPELCHVYVHTDTTTNTKHAVATDSFRLACLTFTADKHPILIMDCLIDGYYTAKQWAELCKAYNKKTKDVKSFLDIMLQVTAMQPQYKGLTYPEYKQILARTPLTTTTGIQGKYNADYLMDFIALIPISKSTAIDTDKITTTDLMLSYKDDTITLLLMKMNN